MKVTVKRFNVLTAAAKDLRDIPQVSDRAAMRAINATAAKMATASRRHIASKINLPQSYIREQMAQTKASPGKLSAAIRTRIRAIRLARFAAKQLTAAAKHKSRSKGDPSRGIAPGRKAAGVSVMVVKGKRTARKQGFLIPLKTAGVQGVFVRTGKGKKDIDHKYSRASPWSLFRRWIEDEAPNVQTELADQYQRALSHLLKGKGA